MNRLILTIKHSGSILSKVLQAPISLTQYQQIVLLLTEPERYMVVERPPIGFGRPEGQHHAEKR